ncbi:hypothetical protein SpCBS45565_g00672 [Spizellomyces sp. 'palustris']|nr:hypothetical protein SpCBS45565_g00672 [Spizellomyces sp. 'palustris']
MDDLLQSFASRITNLKAIALLRAPTLEQSILNNEDFQSLWRAVEDLDQRVGYVRTQILQEQKALEKSHAIHEALDEQRKDLEHMLANVPKHLPLPQRSTKASMRYNGPTKHQIQGTEAENDEENMEGQRPKVADPGSLKILGNYQRENKSKVVGGLRKTKKIDATADASSKKTSAKLNTTVAPVTVAEFESLPKYLVGRLNRDRLNDQISEFAQLVADKHTMMRISPPKMTKNQRDVFWEHRKAATADTTGKAFITEKDVREKGQWSKSAFRLDPTGRSVIAIMRHLGRIKEVRGGGHSRIVIV